MTAGIVPPPSGVKIPINLLRPKDSQLLKDPLGAAIGLGSFGTIPATQREVLGLSEKEIAITNALIGAGAALGLASSVGAGSAGVPGTGAKFAAPPAPTLVQVPVPVPVAVPAGGASAAVATQPGPGFDLPVLLIGTGLLGLMGVLVVATRR